MSWEACDHALKEARAAEHRHEAAEEGDEVEDTGTTAAPVRSGATGLARTTGRNSLASVAGGTNLVRTILGAMLASLRWHHHQGGTTTTEGVLDYILWPDCWTMKIRD